MSRIGHCADGFHAYCGGVKTDLGDGTLVLCACPCHGERVYCVSCDTVPVHDEGEHCGECLSAQAEYYHPEGGK